VPWRCATMTGTDSRRACRKANQKTSWLLRRIAFRQAGQPLSPAQVFRRANVVPFRKIHNGNRRTRHENFDAPEANRRPRLILVSTTLKT